MKIGDKVIFTGRKYNISKLFKYEEIFKNKELIVEDIIKCPCNDLNMDKLKFKGVEGYYRALLFKKMDKK